MYTGIRTGKEAMKLVLFAEDMLVHVEYSKESMKNLLAVISNYSNITGYYVNTQKPTAFLYISNEHLEFDIGKQYHSQ